VTGWLLDTNILSELRRPRPDTNVVAFVESKPLNLLFVSIVTFAEIRFGIERLADAGRRAELNDWLAQKVRPMFEQRVLAISEDVMFKWRLLGRGRPQDRAHLLATRSDHRRDRAASRPDGRHARHQRFRESAGAGSQSVG
jgi:predicted nucleic acid-binding protein